MDSILFVGVCVSFQGKKYSVVKLFTAPHGERSTEYSQRSSGRAHLIVADEPRSDVSDRGLGGALRNQRSHSHIMYGEMEGAAG